MHCAYLEDIVLYKHISVMCVASVWCVHVSYRECVYMYMYALCLFGRYCFVLYKHISVMCVAAVWCVHVSYRECVYIYIVHVRTVLIWKILFCFIQAY